ncbi:MAG: DUF3788 family protein [Planctomycetota bacterium]|jgi:hypothetical protein
MKNKPTETGLNRTLGKIFDCYQDLLGLCEDFQREWKFYKSSGWILKVFDRKKALFWLVVFEGGMRVNFALREKEREALSAVKMGATWRDDLQAAKKYPEGYAFRIEVRTKGAYRDAKRIVKEVMRHR